MAADRMETEFLVSRWRDSALQSQRMSMAILQVNNYIDLRIPSDLGGPDGKKDILGTRDAKIFLAACHYSARGDELTFNEIKNKFLLDLPGVTINKADGFIFFVNQRIREAEQTDLKARAAATTKSVEIYDLARISQQLDLPHGYSIRAQYLNVHMTPEENVGALFALTSQQRATFISALGTLFSPYYRATIQDAAANPVNQGLSQELRTTFISGSAALPTIETKP